MPLLLTPSLIFKNINYYLFRLVFLPLRYQIQLEYVTAPSIRHAIIGAYHQPAAIIRHQSFDAFRLLTLLPYEPILFFDVAIVVMMSTLECHCAINLFY